MFFKITLIKNFIAELHSKISKITNPNLKILKIVDYAIRNRRDI